MKKNNIAIVIVGFNSKKYLEDLFLSIKNSSYKNFQVFYVDNKSIDDSALWVIKNYPKTIIIKNRKNVGFAEGCNTGIKKAIKSNFEYVFLLNPDTILDKNCLQIINDRLNKNKILQPLILLYQKRKTNLVNAAGNILNYLGFSYCEGYKKDARQFKSDKTITLASGAGMVIPINIIKKIGFFDKNFFMYHEDVDFCWRARSSGFNINLIPEAKLWHKYSFSENKNKWFYSERNRLQFIFKNFQLKTLLIISPMFVFNEILVMIYAIKEGWFIKKISACLWLLFHMQEIYKNRKKIQRIKIVPDRKLKRLLKSKLSFQEVELPANKMYNSLASSYWKAIKNLI